jgi:hypothetical protein
MFRRVFSKLERNLNTWIRIQQADINLKRIRIRSHIHIHLSDTLYPGGHLCGIFPAPPQPLLCMPIGAFQLYCGTPMPTFQPPFILLQGQKRKCSHFIAKNRLRNKRRKKWGYFFAKNYYYTYRSSKNSHR